MIINGTVVDLAYSLKNSDGEVLDQADKADPFTYLHGASQIVPGLESALEGLKIGDKKDVTVTPAEGYGEINPDLKLTVSRAQFPKDAEIEEGMQFETQTPDGQGIVFTIEEIAGDKVSIDGNHPLAGQSLHFAVEVLSMREATQEEITHGHAHGPDGHHGHDHEMGEHHGSEDDDHHNH
ncbi:MAG: peptidylprolyl isomerase [Methylotenera sp.]|nr:peptidylprolyl isomerase [Oligoflexia bacterium]